MPLPAAVTIATFSTAMMFSGWMGRPLEAGAFLLRFAAI
jgi:hypothetical protein